MAIFAIPNVRWCVMYFYNFIIKQLEAPEHDNLSGKTKRVMKELDGLERASWINVFPPFEHGELEKLATTLEIPLDFLTDSLDVDERSRYEKEDDCTFILINSPILNDEGKDSEAIYITVPIGIVLTSGYILTICSNENPVLDKFQENKVKILILGYKNMSELRIVEQNEYRFLGMPQKLTSKRNLIE